MAKLDIARLRAVAPPEQAAILRTTLSAPGADVPSLTEQLLESIRAGSIAAPIVDVWLGVTRDPHAAVTCLHQPHGSIARRVAMPHLRRHLRRASTFARTWDALGGAEGLADIMAGLSVRDVRDLCVVFARTSTAGVVSPEASDVRAERQRRITELYHLLNDEDRNPETRPLRATYACLAPACTSEVAVKVAEDLSPKDGMLGGLRNAHRAALEQRALDKVFRETDKDAKLSDLSPFYRSSLDFGVRVLSEFARIDTLRGIDPDDLLTDLAAPLLRRCARRRNGGDMYAEVTAVVNSCLEQHESLRKCLTLDMYLDPQRTRLVERAVGLWAACAEMSQADGFLTTLIGLVPKDSAKVTEVGPLLRKVRIPLRYPLLRLLFRHSAAHGFDIGPASSTDSAMLAGIRLESDVFPSLPPVQAITLFERALLANPDMLFLTRYMDPYSRTLLNCPLDRDSSNGPLDIHALRALLLKRANPKNLLLPRDSASVLEHLRTSELALRKGRAEKGREPKERVFWAILALNLCVALGDADLYIETLRWARRFNKDPHTVKQLYDGDVMRTRELRDMLCVLPARAAWVPDLSDKVRSANAALATLLETATMALREPSFYFGDWTVVLGLIPDVVGERLERLDGFQKRTAISDDLLFESALKPSLELLLQAEETLLKPEHEGLGEQSPNGNLGNVGLTRDSSPHGPLIKFFDGLARGRNALWERHRSQIQPGVLTLSAPWPRGLPVQSLLPSHITTSFDVPYVRQRAEAVVFCDAATALSPAPEDEEVQAAVGVFVESFETALELYLHGTDGEEARSQRVSRAWAYATEELRGDRMSTAEARRLFQKPFGGVGEWWRTVGEEAKRLRLPEALPAPEDPGQPIEWDPDPGFRVVNGPSKARRIREVTCIDCMLNIPCSGQQDWETAKPLAEIFDATIEGGPRPISFWDYCTSPRVNNGAVVDCYVAASILSLNSMYGLDTSLLLQPFPDVQDMRFPAMYLDQDFLERTTAGTESMHSVLRKLKWHAPHQLVSKLAASVLQRTQSETDESKREYSLLVMLIELLLDGDNPSAAGPLIQRLVVENAEASAWHRVLLNTGTMRAFDPEALEGLFVSLSNAIIDRLRTQAQRKATQSTESTSVTPPLVKVTTVKMVAQLLSDTRFIRPRVAIDTLAELLQNAAHVDIRIAAIDSLIHLSENEEQKPYIIELLRAHAVPLAAALNELSPETESDWDAAESGGPLPTVGEGSGAHPVLDILLRHQEEMALPLLDMAYTALQISLEKNARWTALFLKKHGFKLAHTTLPRIPAYIDPLLQTLRGSHELEMPRAEFEVIRDYVLFLLDPPQELNAITEAVKADAELARSNAGKHWLAQWCVGIREVVESGCMPLVHRLGLLALRQRQGKTGIISAGDVEAYVQDMAKRLVKKGELTPLKLLVNAADVVHDESDDAKESPSHFIKWLIAHVDGLRTPAWQADPHRQPTILPDTLPFRLKLCVAPSSAASVEVPRYVDHIVSLLELITSTNAPYFAPYRQLEAHVAGQPSHRLRVIVLLGLPSRFRDPRDPTLVEHLRVLLASVLVLRVREPGDEPAAAAEAREMVQQWEESPVEGFRDVAWRTRDTLRAKSQRFTGREWDWLSAE